MSIPWRIKCDNGVCKSNKRWRGATSSKLDIHTGCPPRIGIYSSNIHSQNLEDWNDLILRCCDEVGLHGWIASKSEYLSPLECDILKDSFYLYCCRCERASYGDCYLSIRWIYLNKVSSHQCDSIIIIIASIRE